MPGVDGVYDKRVIYPDDDGGVTILVPSTHCPSLERLAENVPEGKPYQIVNVSEIPTDRSYRDAWTFVED
jgi:hypothetical protein